MPRPARLGLLASLGLLALAGTLYAGGPTAPRITIYSDGDSCPGGCDAHVVFHPSMNGTAYAHAPGSEAAPSKCQNGSPCRVCLDADATACLEVTYRGAGPHRGTFDFTPAFFIERCPSTGLPRPLREACDALQAAADALAGRVNCIQDPSHARCAALMTAAEEARDRDLPLYEQCRREGEEVFSRGRPQAEQRSLGCAYEKFGTGGPNSKGATWRRLLPAACPAGTFVGRDGLDCCTGVTLVDGPLGRECRGFYPRP